MLEQPTLPVKPINATSAPPPATSGTSIDGTRHFAIGDKRRKLENAPSTFPPPRPAATSSSIPQNWLGSLPPKPRPPQIPASTMSKLAPRPAAAAGSGTGAVAGISAAKINPFRAPARLPIGAATTTSASKTTLGAVSAVPGKSASTTISTPRIGTSNHKPAATPKENGDAESSAAKAKVNGEKRSGQDTSSGLARDTGIHNHFSVPPAASSLSATSARGGAADGAGRISSSSELAESRRPEPFAINHTYEDGSSKLVLDRNGKQEASDGSGTPSIRNSSSKSTPAASGTSVFPGTAKSTDSPGKKSEGSKPLPETTSPRDKTIQRASGPISHASRPAQTPKLIQNARTGDRTNAASPTSGPSSVPSSSSNYSGKPVPQGAIAKAARKTDDTSARPNRPILPATVKPLPAGHQAQSDDPLLARKRTSSAVEEIVRRIDKPKSITISTSTATATAPATKTTEQTKADPAPKLFAPAAGFGAPSVMARQAQKSAAAPATVTPVLPKSTETASSASKVVTESTSTAASPVAPISPTATFGAKSTLGNTTIARPQSRAGFSLYVSPAAAPLRRDTVDVLAQRSDAPKQSSAAVPAAGDLGSAIKAPPSSLREVTQTTPTASSSGSSTRKPVGPVVDINKTQAVPARSSLPAVLPTPPRSPADLDGSTDPSPSPTVRKDKGKGRESASASPVLRFTRSMDMLASPSARLRPRASPQDASKEKEKEKPARPSLARKRASPAGGVPASSPLASSVTMPSPLGQYQITTPASMLKDADAEPDEEVESGSGSGSEPGLVVDAPAILTTRRSQKSPVKKSARDEPAEPRVKIVVENSSGCVMEGRKDNPFTAWSTRVQPGTLADLLPRLDELYDGGKYRHLMREQEEGIWAMSHKLTGRDMFFMSCWNRWIKEKGKIPADTPKEFFLAFAVKYGPILCEADCVQQIWEHAHLCYRHRNFALPSDPIAEGPSEAILRYMDLCKQLKRLEATWEKNGIRPIKSDYGRGRLIARQGEPETALPAAEMEEEDAV